MGNLSSSTLYTATVSSSCCPGASLLILQRTLITWRGLLCWEVMLSQLYMENSMRLDVFHACCMLPVALQLTGLLEMLKSSFLSVWSLEIQVIMVLFFLLIRSSQ